MEKKSSVPPGELGWFLKYATASTYLLFVTSFHLFLRYINHTTATGLLRNSLRLSELHIIYFIVYLFPYVLHIRLFSVHLIFHVKMILMTKPTAKWLLKKAVG